eukprot:g11447.t1
MLAQDVSVAVVGAGPVGLLTALALARRGFRKVRVLDRLPEPERPDAPCWGDPDRSYNLGLGGRGQRALMRFGAFDTVDHYSRTVVGRKDWSNGEAKVTLNKRRFMTKVIARDRCWLLILQVFPGCAGIPFCDPEYLSAVGCPEVEHGIDWQVFLEGTCEKCPPNEPCQLDFEDCEKNPPGDGGAGGREVATAGGAEGAPHFRCAPGLLSTMIIIAQYFLVKEPTPEVAKILGTGASLAPFPFYTSQYSRYANMVPMNLLLCNTQQSSAPSMYNRYVPRVHAEDSGFCGLVYTDDQLVRRCRSLRQNANVLARERIQCPAFEELKVEEGLGRKIQKYQDRANQLQCQDSRGMWHEAMSDIHKCVLITVGHWLRFRPGELVLDWGSGCGHKLLGIHWVWILLAQRTNSSLNQVIVK